jgi:serine/threonine protein kinase
MDSARWDRIQELFHQVADRPPDERRLVLEAACSDDPTLVSDVLALLDEDAHTSLLDHDVADLARDVVGPRLLTSIDRRQFEPYRLLRPLGEGGMGVVYLAERDDLGRAVAVKILRDGTLSPARRERFLAEQRTLAQLNHPGIARLYNAHTLDDGTPWFVMEYVDGVPLTEYCTAQRSSIAERLRLFRAICVAVQHAHEHGIIHRDLKPSNILVKSDGTIRLLDFGIAKHVDPHDTAAAMRTTMRMMTPAYASPEQVEGRAVGVHSDIYSLGVVLYELLTGRLPAERGTWNLPTDASRAQAPETRRSVTHAPPRPSRVMRHAPAAASAPPIGTASWADLDVLCLTALRYEPERRYRSVAALVSDIDRFFNDEPLEARPDGVPYRVGKFVRRHAKTMAAALATFAVAGGVLALLEVAARGPGGSPSDGSTGATPRNSEAYHLYLRSASERYEAGRANAENIQRLERAVALDPGYASAWLALSRRYHVESRHGVGGAAMLDKAVAANEKALAIDPTFIPAAASLTAINAERGDVLGAYRDALALVTERPDSPDAHYALSYALRYAGLLDEAAGECGTALSLEPHTRSWQPCAIVPLMRGDHQAAMGYLQLDPASELAKALTIHTLISTGRETEALQAPRPEGVRWRSYDLLLACAARRPESEIAALAAGVRPVADAETNYYAAAHLAYCGRYEAATVMLRAVLGAQYCAYPAIDTDPSFARLRASIDVSSLRGDAIACQNAFVAQRQRGAR